MTQMTGRERFEAVMAGRAVDRPLYDFWIEDATLNRLFAHIGHRDVERLLDELGVDIRSADAIYPPEEHLGDGVYRNYWGERYVYRTLEWGHQRDDLPGALANAESFEEIKCFPWPKNKAFDYSTLRTQCERIRDKGCVVRYGQADIWQRGSLVRGMENTMTDMYEEPEWTHYISRIFTDFYKEDYRRAWEESGGAIDIFTIISDVGSQRGPLISPAMFREFVLPYMAELIEVIHSFGARAMFHSCGDVSAFIPDIIRAGADILDPIQPVNESMMPAALAQYKGELIFHGGVDVQRLLPNGTPDEVRAYVRRYYETLGSSWIVCPSHYFQPDNLPENILAVYDAFK